MEGPFSEKYDPFETQTSLYLLERSPRKVPWWPFQFITIKGPLLRSVRAVGTRRGRSLTVRRRKSDTNVRKLKSLVLYPHPVQFHDCFELQRMTISPQNELIYENLTTFGNHN